MNSQVPSLVPGQEEKCSDVMGCCVYVTSMQHLILKILVLYGVYSSANVNHCLYEINTDYQGPSGVSQVDFFNISSGVICMQMSGR